MPTYSNRRQPLPDTSPQGPYPGWNMYGSSPGPVSVMPPPASGYDPGGSHSTNPFDTSGYAPTNPPMGPPSIDINAGGPNSSNPNTGGGNPFGGSPTGNFNYYDAGNGTMYVYDADWNYVGTTTQNNGTMGTQSPTGGNYNGTPVPGGTAPSSSPPPAWVGPESHPQNVTGQGGWEGTGSSFSFLIPGGVSARNI